ncbi:hypothetical protein [Paenibacillus mucilaginosus]|uniref:hypothetical protein n=1 Tax=Paenibacillus mucilaginosus TaxID=61624 RepID=UPI0005A2432B|nr:hypothetical protein [Paenibacillus mucilaginosus]MCG7217382.1 hypothetical protein [Paenibacillus mucilaginosus]WDM29049.1 hypothetical protein KCX80_07740 [Paenibacillus mucilaginosus]
MSGNVFAKMLQQRGLSSGAVYATGILKASEVSRMAASFKARESSRSHNNEKAAWRGDFIVNASFVKNLESSIPAADEIGKEGALDARHPLC